MWRQDVEALKKLRSGLTCKDIKRNMCIYGLEDLIWLQNHLQEEEALFVNKFDATKDPVAVACWAEMVKNYG